MGTVQTSKTCRPTSNDTHPLISPHINLPPQISSTRDQTFKSISLWGRSNSKYQTKFVIVHYNEYSIYLEQSNTNWIGTLFPMLENTMQTTASRNGGLPFSFFFFSDVNSEKAGNNM